MEITIELPDAVAARLRAVWQNLPRRALEALAADACRQGVLTSAEVQEVLGIASRWELDGFLKRAGTFLQYTTEDFEEDVRSFAERTGPTGTPGKELPCFSGTLDEASAREVAEAIAEGREGIPSDSS